MSTTSGKKELAQFVAATAIMLAGGLLSLPTAAEIYFEENFESGVITADPNPKWSWPAPVTAADSDSGLMYGPNDIYSISTTVAHSGTRSWRMNFEGRNGWCNTCGTVDLVVTQANIDSKCVSLPGGPRDTVLFNKTDGFSTWPITSSDANQFCFNPSTSLSPSLFNTRRLVAGHTLKIPYRCDVNGIVAGNISRRSDCNMSINYLKGYGAADFSYGKTISRRFYLYIPSNTVLPSTTLKLGYAHFKNAAGSLSANTIKLSVQRSRTLEMTIPGGNWVNKTPVPTDKWYYFEEVFTRESSAGMTDGRYRLYAGSVENGDDVTTPLIDRANVEIGALNNFSFNGNFQHNNDASGYVYFDDALISDGYAGPIGAGAIPPSPPVLLVQ